MGNHSRVPAHWPGSAVTLTALGQAKALPRSLPLPTNQPTGRSDRQRFRPLPGDLGRAVGIPAIGSLRNDPRGRSPHPHLPHDPSLWNVQVEVSFPVLQVMQDSDFPRGEITASPLLCKEHVPARVRHAPESTRPHHKNDEA